MLSVDVTKKCLVGEGWCPVFATNQVCFLCFNFWNQHALLNHFGRRCKQNVFEILLVNLVDSQQIQSVMQKATLDSKSQIEAIFHVLDTKEAPPTYFRTNKFTSSFQEIVDAYGWVFPFEFSCLSILSEVWLHTFFLTRQKYYIRVWENKA